MSIRYKLGAHIDDIHAIDETVAVRIDNRYVSWHAVVGRNKAQASAGAHVDDVDAAAYRARAGGTGVFRSRVIARRP